MGYTSIGDKRIYGKFFNYGRFGPTNIPRSVFRENKEILEEVEYDEKILNNIFNVEFPVVRFKISEFWRIDFNTLIIMAQKMGIQYVKRQKNPNDIEKRALRKSVLKLITD